MGAPPDLTLASGSPRRRELLGMLGARFALAASDAEEQDHPPPPALRAALPPLDMPLNDHPTLRAWRKADAACALAPRNVIIGADTIVALDGVALNKPADPADARRMLRQLAGRSHTVYTGLCVMTPVGEGPKTNDHSSPSAASDGSTRDGLGPSSLIFGRWRIALDLVASDVMLLALDDATIDAYVATGEPLDKAGAYGIQGLGGRLVAAVTGSYTNVVGLPLVHLHRLLTAAGVDGLSDPAESYARWLAEQGKEPLPCPPTFP